MALITVYILGDFYNMDGSGEDDAELDEEVQWVDDECVKRICLTY